MEQTDYRLIASKDNGEYRFWWTDNNGKNKSGTLEEFIEDKRSDNVPEIKDNLHLFSKREIIEKYVRFFENDEYL